MSNESCPPDEVGVGGDQTDLNTPVAPGGGEFVQRHNLQTLSPLCEHGLSPRLIPALLMRILATHFSSPALIMTEHLKQYVWNQDSSLTKLRLALNTHFDPKAGGMLPALIIKRGDIGSERKAGFGDRNESTSLKEMHEGVQNYVRFHVGSARVFVIAEADGEAEDLALEVFDTLTFLAPMIVERLPFHDFQVVKLGQLGVLDNLANKIGVPIDITFAYEYAWAIKPLAPVLKTLNLDLTH